MIQQRHPEPSLRLTHILLLVLGSLRLRPCGAFHTIEFKGFGFFPSEIFRSQSHRFGRLRRSRRSSQVVNKLIPRQLSSNMVSSVTPIGSDGEYQEHDYCRRPLNQYESGSKNRDGCTKLNLQRGNNDDVENNAGGLWQPFRYGMGGHNLYERWIELVKDGHVTAIATIHDVGDDADKIGTKVRYGVKLESNVQLFGANDKGITNDSNLSSINTPNKLNEENAKDQEEQHRLLEFVEILPDSSSLESKAKKRILQINATLTEMQQNQQQSLAIQSIYDGPYAAQLQLIRTLRPPRAKNMSPSSSSDQAKRTHQEKRKDDSHSPCKPHVSCVPPPYDPSADSFLVGPLRLYGHGEFHNGPNSEETSEPRLRTAKLWVPRPLGRIVDPNKDEHEKQNVAMTLMVDSTSSPSANDNHWFDWDVYHNVSPVDPRGHFLLLPALDVGNSPHASDPLGGDADNVEAADYATNELDRSNNQQYPANWRDQSLTRSDCNDMTYLAATIHPPGSMMLSFNSVGAGATQNHIHCHAWVCPPPPLDESVGAGLVDGLDGSATSMTETAAVSAAATKADKFQVAKRMCDNVHGYAATGAPASSTHPGMTLRHGTRVSLLDYPCSCVTVTTVVQMPDLPDGSEKSGGANDTNESSYGGIRSNQRMDLESIAQSPSLSEVQEAVATIVEVAKGMQAPHNAAWTNRRLSSHSDQGIAMENVMVVECFIFFRSQAESLIPTAGADSTVIRLGASEMLGLFHCSSKEQLDILSSNTGSLEQILRNVSLEPRDFVWREVCDSLQHLLVKGR